MTATAVINFRVGTHQQPENIMSIKSIFAASQVLRKFKGELDKRNYAELERRIIAADAARDAAQYRAASLGFDPSLIEAGGKAMTIEEMAAFLGLDMSEE